MDKKLKKEKKPLRQMVYEKYDGHCGYCGQSIEYKKMQVDHIWPRVAGGNGDFDNLMPACRRCNHYKRALTLDMFRRQMLSLHQRIDDIYIFKVAINFGMATLRPFDGQFYFEKVNNNYGISNRNIV
jgi:HNH endonuclease